MGFGSDLKKGDALLEGFDGRGDGVRELQSLPLRLTATNVKDHSGKRTE